MESHDILGGKVHLFRHPDSKFWWANASVAGKQRKTSTKEDSLFHAKQVGAYTRDLEFKLSPFS